MCHHLPFVYPRSLLISYLHLPRLQNPSPKQAQSPSESHFWVAKPKFQYPWILTVVEMRHKPPVCLHISTFMPTSDRRESQRGLIQWRKEKRCTLRPRDERTPYKLNSRSRHICLALSRASASTIRAWTNLASLSARPTRLIFAATAPGLPVAGCGPLDSWCLTCRDEIKCSCIDWWYRT